VKENILVGLVNAQVGAVPVEAHENGNEEQHLFLLEKIPHLL
jgi:hypothetical protein